MSVNEWPEPTIFTRRPDARAATTASATSATFAGVITCAGWAVDRPDQLSQRSMAEHYGGILARVTLTGPTEAFAGVRRTLGDRLFARVAGPEGPRRRERVHGAEGPRWFDEDAAIRRVHGDASMFVGGIRALLMQSLHPLAMAGVMDHSGFEGDPWGRLQRTSYFLAVTTFGTAADADTDGRPRSARCTNVSSAPRPTVAPYAASDPHLLRWVHVAEIDSFLAPTSATASTRSTPTGGTPTSPTPRGWPRRSA